MKGTKDNRGRYCMWHMEWKRKGINRGQRVIRKVK